MPSDTGLTISARAGQLAALQELEQRIGLQLHAEVSRQLRLKQQHEDHKSGCVGGGERWPLVLFCNREHTCTHTHMRTHMHTHALYLSLLTSLLTSLLMCWTLQVQQN